jgi:hypothetical protein
MPKAKDRDFFVSARRIVEVAIGEQMDGGPLESIKAESPKAKAGRIGGQKGGKARAIKLSSSRRRAIAKKAAAARWKKA